MTTDFTYNGYQIVSSGPFKPSGKDMPSDARTRVESYADIASIPNPHVGLKITVKVDETNNNKMTDYIVKSLKANSIGVANSLIDEVERYVDYLGVNTSGSSGEGLTSEQLSNIAKIPAIQSTVDALPNNYASKNHNHSEYASSSHRHDASEIDNLPSGGGTGLTTEQAQQLQTAYEHSQLVHVQASDIPNKTSALTNDSNFVTNSEVNELLKGSGITPPETDQTLRWAIAPETLELTAGVSKEINVTLNNTVDKICYVKFGSNAGLLAFSGTDLFNGQNILLFKNDKTSNNITITANATDRRLVDYIYFGKFNNSGNYKVIPSKIKTIINPSSGTINVESVSLSQNSLSINKGETATLNANILPEGATNKNVTWSTDNSNVSLTPNALSCGILGNVAGSSVVTVTSEDGNKTASCNITISETQTSETYGNIVLSKTSETVSENSTTTFTVKLDASPTNNQTVNLSSNNSDVTLDKNSLVFTSSDYNVEQVVRITIAKDSDYDDDTCKITVTSSNVANAYLDLTITDIDEAPAPSEPTGNIITDGLQVYIDGRDVERGSKQAYWSNKVEGSPLSQIPIANQFGTPPSGWNDTTKTYGWLGDSFRYYFTNQSQSYNTIPNFDENTREFTIEIGFLKEQQTMFNSTNTVFKIVNPENEKTSNFQIAPNADGTVLINCSVNGTSKYTDTSTDTAVKHYAITSNGDDTISFYDGLEPLATLSVANGYQFSYPFSSFGIAKGAFTQNVRVYYLRISHYYL